MRAYLTWAIIGTLILLVAISSITRLARRPETRKSISAKIRTPEITELQPTLAEITNSTIAFFDADGIPLVGFVYSGANKIVLFSSPSGASTRGEKISPVTREIVDAYIRNLKNDAEARVAKARESAEAAAALRRVREEEERREQALRAAARAKSDEQERRVMESNAVVRAREELAAYRSRYIQEGESFDRAILIVDEIGTQNRALSSFVSESLHSRGSRTTHGFFKPAFVADGLFANAFSGQSDTLTRLPLKGALGSMLLGKQSVKYTPNPQLSDTITASMTLELSAVSADGFRPLLSQTLRSLGAGFSKEEARASAEEQIMSQLRNGILDKFERSLSP